MPLHRFYTVLLTQHMPSRRGGSKRVVCISLVSLGVRAVAAKNFWSLNGDLCVCPRMRHPVDGPGTHTGITAHPGTQASGVVDLP